MLVKEHVEACVRRIADGGCAEAGEEAAESFAGYDIAGGRAEGGVVVERRFVADFEDRQGHEDEACEGAGDGAGEEVAGIGEFREGGGMWVGLGGARGGGYGEEGDEGGILADGVEAGEVDGGAEAGSKGRRDGAAPESGDEVRCGADLGYGGAEGVRAGLLDAGLEEVDGLEENGREDARAEAGNEVEGWEAMVVSRFGGNEC